MNTNANRPTDSEILKEACEHGTYQKELRMWKFNDYEVIAFVRAVLAAAEIGKAQA